MFAVYHSILPFYSDGDHEGNVKVLPPLETKERTIETLEEPLQEQRRDSTSSHGEGDSDDEPLVKFVFCPILSQNHGQAFLVDN